jgi:hypothetical protein
MRDGAVSLLDQQTPDAVPAEIDRKAEADRPAAHDQHWSVATSSFRDHLCLRLKFRSASFKARCAHKAAAQKGSLV